MADEIRLPIRTEADIVTARLQARALGEPLGFSPGELTAIATAISEVARNILLYAREGEIVLGVVQDGERRGIALVARDRGPGIPNIALALQDGYSTGKGLGLGLPGTKRLMDEFAIESDVGRGTTVSAKKWKRKRD